MAGVIDAAAHAHEAVALGEATEEVRSTVPLNPLTRASPPLIDDGQLALAGSDGGRIPSPRERSSGLTSRQAEPGSERTGRRRDAIHAT